MENYWLKPRSSDLTNEKRDFKPIVVHWLVIASSFKGSNLFESRSLFDIGGVRDSDQT